MFTGSVVGAPRRTHSIVLPIRISLNVTHYLSNASGSSLLAKGVALQEADTMKLIQKI